MLSPDFSLKSEVKAIYVCAILILSETNHLFMPVDRELAYESLKWIDPKVYRAYLRLKYREVTDEEIQKDRTSFYKLRIIAQTLDVVDSLEQRGVIEIINDYENERILVRKNQYQPNKPMDEARSH